MKGNENCFELAEGSSFRGFEIPGVNCTCHFTAFLMLILVFSTLGKDKVRVTHREKLRLSCLRRHDMKNLQLQSGVAMKFDEYCSFAKS